MVTYYAVTFTKPQEFAQNGYMVVTDPNIEPDFVDIQGNPVTLPQVCEYVVTSPEPQTPSWGA